ncbi:MAG: hypothetical protein AAF141_03995 [Pseudomonadota bacterium]
MEIFDADAFDELTAGDAGLQQDLLQIARAERANLLAEAQITDVSGEAAFAHKLRGFAANLCGPSLTGLAENWRTLSPPKRELELKAELDQLIDALTHHLTKANIAVGSVDTPSQ